MYIIIYKVLYKHIFCSVFAVGLIAMGVVALFVAWVQATHHANS